MIATLDWPVQIAGERASIRRFEASVIEADWLSEAAQAIAGRAAPCHLQARLDDGDQAWWIIGDGETVGALSGKLVRLNDSSATPAAIWTWLAVDARWRAYGYGGAAVPLFEQAVRRLGADTVLAPLPPDNGVALYFWLRLGYTPQRSVAVSAPDLPTGVATDALWMQRPLNPTDSDSADHPEE